MGVKQNLTVRSVATIATRGRARWFVRRQITRLSRRLPGHLQLWARSRVDTFAAAGAYYDLPVRREFLDAAKAPGPHFRFAVLEALFPDRNEALVDPALRPERYLSLFADGDSAIFEINPRFGRPLMLDSNRAGHGAGNGLHYRQCALTRGGQGASICALSIS